MVPFYFAADRPTIERNGQLLVLDDERLRPLPGDKVATRRVRFRTLGCYPLTAAVASDAASLDAVVAEIAATRVTERGETRADDRASEAAMEDRKRVGYF